MAEQQPSGAPAPVPRTMDDPRALRALAHPVRLSLFEALVMRGNLTATQASGIVGGTPTSVAYHLRTLAKYGYVEEAEGGVGRERPWRLTAVGLMFDSNDPDPGKAAAAKALGRMFFQRWMQRHEEYRAARVDWPAEVREATEDFSFLIYGTPAELRELHAEMVALAMRFYDRITDPAQRPAGSVPFETVLITHPIDTSVYESGDDGGAGPGDEPAADGEPAAIS